LTNDRTITGEVSVLWKDFSPSFCQSYATAPIKRLPERAVFSNLELNAKYQLLVCADDVDLLTEGSKFHIGKYGNTSKEVRLEVNAKETKYMFMSRHQNPCRNEKLPTANKTFENVTKFKYSGTTNKNKIAFTFK
jgi:hypothetical protein